MKFESIVLLLQWCDRIGMSKIEKIYIWMVRNDKRKKFFKELLLHPNYETFAKNLLKDVKESNSDLQSAYFGTITKKMV